MNKKNNAKPLKNIIPAKLNSLNRTDGWCFLSKNLPVTNLKLKIANTGAITNDKTVAKSTNSLRLSPNCNITESEPLEMTSRKIT